MKSDPTGKGAPEERSWDLIDRCLLPLLFSHAAAIILSTILFHVSTFPLFVLFLSISLAATLFYHNLKVTSAGKTVLITGCESRLSYAVAKYLDELGFTIIACFSEEGERSKRLKDESSGRVHILQMDITSEQSIHQVYEYTVQLNQGLWALINASCWAAFGEVQWVPISVFKKSTDMNLLGNIRITQAFLPLIQKTKGRIVNVVSILGRIPGEVRSPLCAVSSAIEAYSKCLRRELRRSAVDVVIVEPSHYTTGNWFERKEMLDQSREMWERMDPETRNEQEFERRITLMSEYQQNQEGDLSVVLKCFADSVTRTFPLQRYTPLTTKEKVEALVAHHLPASVYDILYN